MQPPAEPGSVGAGVFDWTVQELRSAQAKITYIGEQTRPILTVVFSAGDETLPASLDHFAQFQRSRKIYSNDRLSTIRRFTVSPEQFHRILSAVRPVLTGDAPSAGNPIVSFTVTTRISGHFRGREFLLNRDSGERFYRALMSAFEGPNAVPEPLSSQFRSIFP
jgi:hypothetical protein